MIAPLAAGYREAVLWQEQAPTPVDGSPPALPARADVVVVGAGYAGLSAGRALADAGRSVVVLDSHPVGWGASTRNGGMVIPELKAGPAALERTYGPLGRRMYAEVNEAFDHVESLAAGPAPAIACDYARTGQLYLAHSAERVAGLEAMAREHGDGGLGEPVRFVPRDELCSEIGSDSFHGGVVIERTGGLHPARFHAGLVRASIAAGVTLVGATRATAVSPRPGLGSPSPSRPGFRVATTRGPVEAGDVVVCANATADGLVPALRRRVLPVGSFIIATEMLDPDLAAAVSPRNRMLVDTRNFLHYWRLTPDGRMLFGGRRSLSRSTIPEARDFLYAEMLGIHPQLAGVGVARAWGGEVAITLDRLPHVGRLGGVWYAAGCNGSGVALHTWLGMRIGQHMAGNADPPSFTKLRHRPIPLHRARRAWLPAVGAWFHWQDRR